MPSISIIICTTPDQADPVPALVSLQPLRAAGHEVILTGANLTANPLADRTISHAGTFASRLNTAASTARGEVLVFVHAATCLPADTVTLIAQALAPGNRVWGRFDLRYSGMAPVLRLLELLANPWSRYMNSGSLRHGIFVSRLAYEQAGRFPDIPLFSDIAFCRALRQLTRPACVRTLAITSSTQMETQGIWKSVLLSAWLRLSFALGVEPGLLHVLARRYRILDAAAPAE